MQVVRIFVSSPGDVRAERDILDTAIDEVNRSEGERCGVVLRSFRWERDVAPHVGPPPQAVVDQATPPYDIYLGIMAARFGTPTEGYGSGTEKEFQDAMRQWAERERPWIMFYFHKSPPLPQTSKAVSQYAKVVRFREKIERRGIVCQYESVSDGENSFLYLATRHLRELVQRFGHAPPADAARRPTAPAAPILPAGYISWLQNRCGELELLGLRLKHGQGVRLNHVYTPLTTQGFAEGIEAIAGTAKTGSGLRRATQRAEGDESRPQMLLDLLGQRSLYVSGDPGTGKSTFCRWTVWLVCQQTLPPADVAAPDAYRETFPAAFRDRLPVLIRLRDFWPRLPHSAGARTMTVEQLEDALAAHLAQGDWGGLSWSCVAAHLERGSALLILDGVDEVPPLVGQEREQWYPREMLLNALAAAVARWDAAGNRVLVTSRPYGLNEDQRRALGLPHAPIDALDAELQQLLVRRWFYRLSEDHAQGLKTADEMVQHVRAQPGLGELAANPLLLSSMCIIYDEGKRLPQDRYELYDRIVDTVLHKRYPPVRERVSVIRGRLGAVALGMHTGGGPEGPRASPEPVASDAEIDETLKAYRQQDGATEQGWSSMVEVREDLLTQTGLLVSRDDKRAAFYHLSFQEFLAAEQLFVLLGRNEDALQQVFLRRGPAAGWRNTLSFLFGCWITKFNVQAGVELMQKLAPQIAAPASPDWNLAIVLSDCLDILLLLGRRATLPDDLRAAYESLVKTAIQREAPVEQRHALAATWGRLGDPRIEADLRIGDVPERHPGYVLVPAGTYCYGDKKEPFKIERPFLISRYPVTNSQFAKFIESGGYGERRFWSEEGWRWLQRAQVNEPDYWRDPRFNAPNQPVVGISFWEAEALAKWAGGRLPTEREWEAAARGPEGYEYPWGDRWKDGICNSIEAGLKRTSAVGIFPRSKSAAFGLEDMAGNVFDWCVPHESGEVRVLRGGCWFINSRFCRAAIRYWLIPVLRSH